jgi:hypothetical protein
MRSLLQSLVVLFGAVLAGLIILGLITGVFAQPGGWKVFALVMAFMIALAFAFELLQDRD